MQMEKKNDWLILNDMIYKIYTTKNINDMLKGFINQLKTAIEFDGADILLYNKYTGVMEQIVRYNCDESKLSFLELQSGCHGVIYNGRSMIYRDSDILKESERTKTVYYKKVYLPNNWHYSLKMILACDGKFCGVVNLYRTIGKEDFQFEDISILDLLKEHISYRVYQAELLDDGMERMSLATAVENYNLTRREEQIVSYLLNGKRNEEIAAQLVISLNTLKKHLMNIYKKMNINSKNQILTMIRQAG